MIIATCSDFAKHRWAFTLLPICVSIAGFAILLAVHHHKHAQYAALFLCTMGTYSAMPVVVCWFNMNLGGHHRRAIGSAWQIGFGNTGGIIAVFAFLAKDAPDYKTGYSICVSFLCLSAVSCCVYGVGCFVENRRRVKMPTSYDGPSADAGLGDLAPSYRYQL